MTASVQSRSGPNHPTDSVSWLPRRKSDGPVPRFLLVPEVVQGQKSKLTCQQYLLPFGPAVFRLHNQRPKDERKRAREACILTWLFLGSKRGLFRKKKNMTVSNLRKKDAKENIRTYERGSDRTPGKTA